MSNSENGSIVGEILTALGSLALLIFGGKKVYDKNKKEKNS
jgi:hypothetical protein